MVSDGTILRVLAEHRDLERAAKELVRLANRAGGEDNITVVAFAVTGAREESALEQTTPLPALADDEDTLDELDGVPAIQAPPGPAAENSNRRRWWPAVALAAIVAALIVLWLLLR
jgi:serine/threonine protein phosphatase PrpC